MTRRGQQTDNPAAIPGTAPDRRRVPPAPEPGPDQALLVQTLAQLRAASAVTKTERMAALREAREFLRDIPLAGEAQASATLAVARYLTGE